MVAKMFAAEKDVLECSQREAHPSKAATKTLPDDMSNGDVLHLNPIHHSLLEHAGGSYSVLSQLPRSISSWVSSAGPSVAGGFDERGYG